MTPTRGAGSGEYLARFPVSEGDHILADRGYATAAGLRHVSAAGGRITVRANTGALSLRTPDGAPFDLLAAVSGLTNAGAVGSWPVATAGEAGVCGRICAVRKSAQAAARARRTARREARRQGSEVRPATLAFARYVIVFTTFSEEAFSAREVLEWYRLRWQVELVFKRLKSSWRNWATCQARRRERPRLALRKTPCGAAGGQAGPSRPRRFPLGIRPGAAAVPIVPGGSSVSSSTRSAGPSSRPSVSPARSTSGTTSPKHSPNRRDAAGSNGPSISINKQVSAYGIKSGVTARDGRGWLLRGGDEGGGEARMLPASCPKRRQNIRRAYAEHDKT